MGQIIQERIKKKFWRTALKNFTSSIPKYFVPYINFWSILAVLAVSQYIYICMLKIRIFGRHISNFFIMIFCILLCFSFEVSKVFRRILQFLWQVKSKGNLQKQPSRGVLKKRFSENMQPIYTRTPMPKCNFNKVPAIKS